MEIEEVGSCIEKALDTRQPSVISVCGITGLGKSTFIRQVCDWVQYREVDRGIDKYTSYTWVDVPHPFSPTKFCGRLLLSPTMWSHNNYMDPTMWSHSNSNYMHTDFLSVSEDSGIMKIDDPIGACRNIIRHRSIIVFDDLQSKLEWDAIEAALLSPRPSETVIIVITSNTSVTRYCATQELWVRNVKVLESGAALQLYEKVTGMPPTEEEKVIIKKCGGIPKVIDAIARIPRKSGTRNEKDFAGEFWQSLKHCFMDTLETHPLSQNLRGIFDWMHSYFRTCPDFLKPCIFYISIFPQDYMIRRRRLVRRWIAEGYARDTDGKTAEENGEVFVTNLVNLRIVQHGLQTCSFMLQNCKAMHFCQFNSFFREYIISRPMEDNQVCSLEGHCRMNAQRPGRHMVISRSWDRDINVFNSIDLSRLRSLTVFGKWETYFVSDKMKLLRVLDLEDATGVADGDLQNIGKQLPRLKFLSLRGCKMIRCLPNSLGDLKQLQTLDIRHTSITTLPRSIANLQKLQYVRAGTTAPLGDNDGRTQSLTPEGSSEMVPAVTRSSRSRSPWLSKICRRPCVRSCCGVKVPPRIGALTALHTLGVVSFCGARGVATMEGLRNLTQLHKLGVSGINHKNIKRFLLAIGQYAYLESLSVRLDGDSAASCMDGTSCPNPENLQHLKLFGCYLDTLPAWIELLRNLTSLAVQMTTLNEEDICVLSDLPMLHILKLCIERGDEHGRLFVGKRHPAGHDDWSLRQLQVLEICCSITNLNLQFGHTDVRSLQVLKVHCFSGGSLLTIDSLFSLNQLKSVSVKGSYSSTLKKNLKYQLRYFNGTKLILQQE